MVAGGEPGVDGHRVLRRLADLGQFGADSLGGVTRLGFSEHDRQAQQYIAREATEAGLCARVDAAGNLLVSRADADMAKPRLLLGSHLDTVINGGRLDGAYGVVAALEVLQLLAEPTVTLSHEPVAVAFANEEGALFPQPFWGSLALSGQFDKLPADPLDRFGQSLREPLRLAGGDLDALRTAAWLPESIAAYLEIHIEQGPILAQLGVPIGVVDAIIGRTVFEIEVSGLAGHAGTTPMEGRRDALVAASQIVLAASTIARGGTCRVATAGRLTVRPGATNVVPGHVAATVEFRDGSAQLLDQAEREFMRDVHAIRESSGCLIEAVPSLRTQPVHTTPYLRDVIAAASADVGLASTVLPSGAGHDAQVVAAIAPIGMIFVPSLGGVSHVPEEATNPADLVAGAEVLLRAVRLLVAPREQTLVSSSATW